VLLNKCRNAGEADKPILIALSSRPDTFSGGKVLVEVRLPIDAKLANPRLAATEPLPQNVSKCNLNPATRADDATGPSDRATKGSPPERRRDYSSLAEGRGIFTQTWLTLPQPGRRFSIGSG
jgi:hypothetical protein